MTTTTHECTTLPENYSPSWQYIESSARWTNYGHYYAHVGTFPQLYMLYVESVNDEYVWTWRIKEPGKPRARVVRTATVTYATPEAAKQALAQAFYRVLAGEGLV